MALQSEIKNRYKGEVLETLYFGGGTPSLLSPTEFKNLIELFNTNRKTEVTAELNPETVTSEYLSEIKASGINRISFGCQTFNDKILEIIGRRHTSQDVIDTVKKSQNAGFKNISLDFIYGLPEQTSEMFENDLKKALTLDIQHVSLYGLKIDEGCYFYKNPPQNLPDDDMQADMYLKAIEILTAAGFDHYEISNFAKKGYPSAHNLNYWKNNSYYGFGTAAHGYEKGIRYFNTSNLNDYIKKPLLHSEEHVLSEREKLEEEIFLGFRKMSGIDIMKINKKFNINFEEKYISVLKKYLSTGHLFKNGNYYRLSDKGILVSNTILSEFLN